MGRREVGPPGGPRRGLRRDLRPGRRVPSRSLVEHHAARSRNRQGLGQAGDRLPRGTPPPRFEFADGGDRAATLRG